MNLRFLATGLFWLLALLACTAQEQPLQPELSFNIFRQQSGTDSYPYDLDVCSKEDSSE